ncbi:unnamed protein product, partial [Polarella glacialis]
ARCRSATCRVGRGAHLARRGSACLRAESNDVLSPGGVRSGGYGASGGAESPCGLRLSTWSQWSKSELLIAGGHKGLAQCPRSRRAARAFSPG